MPWLSITEYAKKRGVSRQRISKLIHSGRLKSATREKGKRQQIDPDKADKVLDENIDQAWGDQVKLSKPAENSNSGNGGPAPGPYGGDVKGPDYIIKITKAHKMKFELDILTGKYVPVVEVEAGAFNRARALRDALVAMPERVAAILAAETDPLKIIEILHIENSRILEELSR